MPIPRLLSPAVSLCLLAVLCAAAPIWAGDTLDQGPSLTDEVPYLAQVPPGPTKAPDPLPAGSRSTPAPGTSVAPRSTAEPPPAAPPTQQPPPDSLASLMNSPSAIEGLAGTPDMFGDFYGPRMQLSFRSYVNEGTVDLPLSATSGVAKIAEDGNTLPQNRVFFLYNHFQDALREDVVPGVGSPVSNLLPIDRYTIGFEKIFLENWSFEVRMPLLGQNDFSDAGFSLDTGSVGNLALIIKRLVFKTETSAGCVGLAIDTPTGSDVTAHLSNTSLTIRNDAVRLLPFAGLLWKPGDRFFCQSFVQVDVPTNGDRVEYNDPLAGTGTAGTLYLQPMLYVDFSAGYWIRHVPGAGLLTGLAAIAETHYTSTLQDAGSVDTGTFPNGREFSLGSTSPRSDIVDFSVGLHAEFNDQTVCRVCGVFPLRTGDDRSFNSELQVQLTRRF